MTNNDGLNPYEWKEKRISLFSDYMIRAFLREQRVYKSIIDQFENGQMKFNVYYRQMFPLVDNRIELESISDSFVLWGSKCPLENEKRKQLLDDLQDEYLMSIDDRFEILGCLEILRNELLEIRYSCSNLSKIDLNDPILDDVRESHSLILSLLEDD